MKKIISIFIVFIVCSLAFASKKLPVSPPANVHPRLMFMEKDIPQIKENLEHSENSFARMRIEKFINDLKNTQDGGFIQKGKICFSGEVLCQIEAAAFKYALEKDPELAKLAYKKFMKCCSTLNIDELYDKYRVYGQMMYTAAEIYDWCFDALDKKQKKSLISKALEYANLLQIGYPPVGQGAVTGHGSEGQLLKYLLGCGIAFYDENPEVWKMSAQRFYEEFLPVRNFVYDSREPNFQGCEYGPYRAIFDVWASLLIQAFGGKDPYDGKISEWGTFFLVAKRPDELAWRNGDNHSIERNSDPSMRYASIAFLCFAESKNPYLKFYVKENTRDFSNFSYNKNGDNDDYISPVQFLIFNDTSVEPMDYQDLDTVYYAPYPMGEYYAASGRKNRKAAAVHAKIGEWFSANHEHCDAGTFEIFCNGILANVSGFYESGNDYKSSPMTQSYFHSSVSKNSILLEPAEPSIYDYGAQKLKPEVKTLKEWKADESYHRSRIIKYEDKKMENCRLVYLSGDISAAYGNSGKVLRSMLSVFTGDEEKPLVFVVYDQIQGKNGRSGVFLLHSNSEIEVSEDGKTQLINNVGFLKNTTLLPAAVHTTKIGGTGRRWEVLGENMGNENHERLKGQNESGWGRIEIRPARKEKQQEFLNVMQISPLLCEHSTPVLTEESEYKLIELDNMQIKVFRDMSLTPEVILK